MWAYRELINKPLQLRLRAGNDSPVAGELGFLACVFVNELGVNLSTDDEDFEGHAEFASEGVGILLGLALCVASDGEGGFLELDEKVLFEDVASEEEVGAVGGVGADVVFDDGAELAIAGHEAVFGAEDPEVVLQGGVHLLFCGGVGGGEAVEGVEELQAALGLGAHESEVAETEFFEGGGEVEDIHPFGFMDILADGPVFIFLQSIHHKRSQRLDALHSFLAIQKGTLH